MLKSMDLQLFGGLFGSSSKSTTTTTPYSGEYASQLKDFYNLLQQRLNTPAQAYPGQLTTGMTSTQQSATSGLSALTNTPALTDTISGKYLSPDTNPYLDQYYNQAAQKVKQSLGDIYDQVNAAFNTRGLYNSSARQEALQEQANKAADELANIATNIYGSAYNQERANQMNAINQQAGLYNSLFNQGTTEQQINQAALDAQYREWLRQQGVDESDIDRMMQYFGLVKNPSQTTTTSSSGLGGLFSGALYGLGSALGQKWGR